MRPIAGCGLLLVLVALVGVVAVLSLQRRVLFPAPRVDALPTPAMPGEERVTVVGRGGDVEVLLLPPTVGVGPRPWLLFAHGNGEVIDLWAGAFEELREQGIGIALVEYPGYGRSPGRPSESAIHEVMVGAYDLVARRPDVDDSRIYGYGRSLGGGAVCALARDRDLAGLVLESSFTSVRSMARGLGVPGFLVLDPFDNEAAVRDFEGPVLVIHGERDRIVPIEHGRRLAEVAPNGELLEVPCGHNDCPRPWSALLRFLER